MRRPSLRSSAARVRVKSGQGILQIVKIGWLCFLGIWGIVLLASAQDVQRQSTLQPDVQRLARAVDDHYNHLHSLEGEFTETYRGEGMERVESGTLWLKKPRKMRWEYRSPKEKLFVSDGQTVWFYVPAERQLRKTEFRKLDDIRSPIAFLLGKTKLEKELQGLSLAPDIAPLTPGEVVLRGVPTALADQVSEIVLEISPDNRITRIVVQSVDGAATEYRFTGQKEDLAIADGRFGFKPPAGTEIVDAGLE